MNLFHIEEGICKPLPETVLIEPFKSLWERDTSKKKENAIRDFTYINFMVSPFSSNPFRDIMDERERSNKIIEGCFKGKYNPDLKVMDALVFCEEEILRNRSLSYKSLVTTKKSLNKVQKFLDDVDLTELSPKGILLYKPIDITRAIKDMNMRTEELKKLEITVMEEYKESSRTKSNSIINPLEK